jgi:hypothetical protein
MQNKLMVRVYYYLLLLLARLTPLSVQQTGRAAETGREGGEGWERNGRK